MLREAKISFEFGSEVEAQDYPSNLGSRSKLGGMPNWIQPAEIPRCASCKQSMTFILQLDSIDYGQDDAQYMFGDVGMIYIFFCFRCCKPLALFQSY